ncbi:NAD(+) synthase [Desulfocicer niacini]
MTQTEVLHELLQFDKSKEVQKIVDGIRLHLRKNLKRRGLVVAVSGGIDSSVSAALSAMAVGPEKVLGLLLPERDSSGESSRLGNMLLKHLGIDSLEINISATLEAIGCYMWRDDAVREIFPDYGDGWKSKITIAGGGDGGINYFHLIVRAPDGTISKKRMELKQYLQIVAATNFKQRIRKTLEYFHADRLNYAVVGTPNRMEYDQGFFVKNGDGSSDIKPIAHLYKTQVYELARYLELPQEICSTTPTTDTFSLSQGQDEFYYGLPFEKMDLALWAYNHDIYADELAKLIHVTEDVAGFVLKDIERKRRTTAMLHWPGLLIEPVEGPVTAPPV